MNKILKSTNGATLVEMTVVLPIFLIGLSIFLWIGLTFQARTSFESAMGTAVRYASSRGEVELSGSMIIPEIHNTDSSTPIDPELAPMLFSEDIPPGDGLNNYNGWLTDQGCDVFDVRDLPFSYLYALVYVNQAMKQKVGDSLRFPCEPNADDGDNCLKCQFINSDAYFVAGIPHPSDPDGVPMEAEEWVPNPRRVAFHCEYKPSNVLMKPISSLFSVLGLGGAVNPVFSETRIIELP